MRKRNKFQKYVTKIFISLIYFSKIKKCKSIWTFMSILRWSYRYLTVLSVYKFWFRQHLINLSYTSYFVIGQVKKALLAGCSGKDQKWMNLTRNNSVGLCLRISRFLSLDLFRAHQIRYAVLPKVHCGGWSAGLKFTQFFIYRFAKFISMSSIFYNIVKYRLSTSNYISNRILM
jgi:hypothetical protein